MNTHDLGGPLLASVSRSFYLTIRLLPARLRGPIGLAYLLARASDTIADSAEAAPTVRLRHLAAFQRMLQAGESTGLEELQREIRSAHPGERELMATLDRCLTWLGSLPEFEQAEIRTVMQRIIRGQTLDLKRFSAEGATIALPDAAALEEYTYLVAGCVGEFWTRICLHHLPRYSALDPGALTPLGVNFGKGLQLVNILRDLPADLRTGRCYLPNDELHAANVLAGEMLQEPAKARVVMERWLARAEELLDDGRRYIRALRPARLRIGCFLPWYLGRKTLTLLRHESPLEARERLKVPRRTVRSALAISLLVAWSNAPLASSRTDQPFARK